MFEHLQAFRAQATYADRVFVVPRLTETQHVDRLVTFHGDDVVDFPAAERTYMQPNTSCCLLCDR